MIAIITKYHGPTNTRGARISAERGDDPKSRIYVSRHGAADALDGEALHRVAADALCAKFGWTGRLIGGGAGGGYVFTFDPLMGYVNDEGLTFAEWIGAARCFGVPSARNTHGGERDELRAYLNSEDPTEWAAIYSAELAAERKRDA